RRPERHAHRGPLPVQLQDADQRDDERDQVERAPRRRELEGEGDEDLADAQHLAPPPRLASEPLLVEAAREEAVGVARVVSEQPLQIFSRDIAREVASPGVEPVRTPGTGLLRHALLRIRRCPSCPSRRQIKPISRPTAANASSAYCRSSRVCVAVTIVRTRALSRATVGKAIPCANTPRSKSLSDSSIALAPSPAMTVVIGLSLSPVLKPRRCSPSLKKRVLSHNRSMISGSCSSTSSAAMQAITTDGGCDVENRNGRARW